MKNKTVCILLSCMLAFGLGACGSQSNSVNSSSNASASVSAEAVESESDAAYSSMSFDSTGDAMQDAILAAPVVDGDVATADCIKLGNYKGLKLTRTVQEVTDSDVQSNIQSSMTAEEVSDANATAQKGDTVNIAYDGKVDGKEFDGGKSDSYDLVLGSGTFIDGFEDGVVGMKKGETKDLNLKFPDDYTADLAGKDVVFTVTVNAIKRVPELTDDWVKSNTDGKYTTVKDYEASVRADLEKQNEEAADQAMQGDAWNQVEAASTFLELPEKYVKEGRDSYEENAKSMAEQYGYSLDDYITQAGLTKDDYQKYKEQYGRFAAASRVLLDALVDAEKITTDSQEYKDELQKAADLYSMTTDDLIKQNGEDNVQQYVLTQVVVDHIISYADVTDVTSSSSSDSTSSAPSEAVTSISGAASDSSAVSSSMEPAAASSGITAASNS